MKILLIFIASILLSSSQAWSQPCTPAGDEVSYGTTDVWIGYVYDNSDFTAYHGFVNNGAPGSPNFDESFGGDNISYTTNGCPVNTETFSVRYKLRKTFAPGSYEFTIGGDDGFRLSIDGGNTWIISQWWDQGYNTASSTTALNGTYDMVLEFYENGGGNRISFQVQPTCVGTEDQSLYGAGNVWRGYIYDGVNFNVYKGMVTEGAASQLNFDEGFGGDNVSYNTSGCSVQTETFSARYRLQKNFPNGNYLFTVGGDDGYRLSIDGGATWVINHWADQSYNTSSCSIALNGTYNLVLEFYESGGQNRITLDMSATLLPVQLLSFEGKAGGKTVVLQWTAAFEVNTDYYQVERSANGIDFTALGKINSTNGQGNKKYQYTDLSALAGNNYYRLKTVDRNLVSEYSQVIRVVCQQTGTTYFYPTVLSGGDITLKTGVAVSHANLVLYDMTGRQAAVIRIPGSLGAGQSVPLRVGNLSKGMYILVLRSGLETVHQQTIILE
jgi:hypothetical protein